MSIYLYPIRQAALVFMGAFVVLLIPMMIHQYRKYGAVSGFRSIVLYSFLFYMIAAFFLVILPLPPRDSVVTSYRDMMQLHPFRFVGDFIRDTSIQWRNPHTYVRGITEGVFIQPVFNVFLTIPFGIYLRYYFKKSLKETFIYTLLLTLFFEFTQLSGLYGYYSGPYRYFDVDDLFLNTLGGLLGYACTPLITAFFPSKEAMDQTSFRKGQAYVTYIRRFLAYFVDLIIIQIIGNIAWVLLEKTPISEYFGLVTVLITIAYFTFAVRGGQTPGHKLLKIKLVSAKNQDDPSRWQLLSRILLLTIFVTNTITIGMSVFNYLYENNYLMSDSSIILVWALMGIGAVWAILLIANVVFTRITKSYQLFYDRLTKTYMISVTEQIEETK